VRYSYPDIRAKEKKMFQTNVFDYVRILDKAADASWLRNDAISNNIANVDTPGYKRQDVAFEAELKKALGSFSNRTTDEKVETALSKDLTARTYTDYSDYSYRLDGNNVDIENENVMLAENQLKYQGLLTSIQQEFENLQTVMK
jgi:flagellar basal-body rod protein FlgB